MQQTIFTRRTAAEIAESFVLSRRPGSVVSTADAVKAVRYITTICEHSDTELADIVASIAISHGRTVAFDVGVRDCEKVQAA
jgi:hypothetical protein